MKKLLLLPLLLMAAPPLAAQPPGIENQEIQLLTLPGNDKILRFYGHQGRHYFIQVSDTNSPLANWAWAPIIETGNGTYISYEVDGTASKGFFRLKYSTNVPGPGETPDTADFDGDGISNIGEIDPAAPFAATDPLDSDTDNDFMPDGWERAHGFDPNDNGSADPANGPDGDADGDGESNRQEYEGGTDPRNPGDFPVVLRSVSNLVSAGTNHAPPDQLSVMKHGTELRKPRKN